MLQRMIRRIRKKDKAVKKIMIIDDDDDFLQELQEFLVGEGYDAVAVSDPTMTFDKIITVQPDLILLDLKMPSKNGFQLAKEIRSQNKIPLIILSGYVDDASRYMAIKNKAAEFLAKPVDLDKLKFHIEDILAVSNPQSV